MKNLVICLVCLGLFPSLSVASDKALREAKKYISGHHYSSAIESLMRINHTAPKPNHTLMLGSALAKNAVLHKRLHQISLEAQIEYLTQLRKSGSKKEKSVYSSLFLGEAYLAKGDLKNAGKNLRRFVSNRNASKTYRNIAHIKLATIDWRNRKRKQAENSWQQQAKSKDPLVVSELAVVNSMYRRKSDEAQRQVDFLLNRYPDPSEMPSRVLSNIIAVYQGLGKTYEGLQLLFKADIASSSHTEDFKSGKNIKHYDMNLLGRMAKVYRSTAIAQFQELEKQERLRHGAQIQQADLHLAFGDHDAANKAISKLRQPSKLPAKTKAIFDIRLAAGNQETAPAKWLEVITDHSRNSALVSQVMLTCLHTKANCAPLAKALQDISEGLRGAQSVPVNFALGEYYFRGQQPAQALEFLEAARNKSLKNKIEANDPLLLVALSEIYRKDKQYSENLEIYFEMSKEFPSVRQIQEAVQGVYATQQRSAGDVKIF